MEQESILALTRWAYYLGWNNLISMNFRAFLCKRESWNLDPRAVLDSEWNNVGRTVPELYQVLC